MGSVIEKIYDYVVDCTAFFESQSINDLKMSFINNSYLIEYKYIRNIHTFNHKIGDKGTMTLSMDDIWYVLTR